MIAQDQDDIGLHKAGEIMSALRKAGFTREMLEVIPEAFGNTIATLMFEAVTDVPHSPSLAPTRANYFDVIMPANYEHGIRIGTFISQHVGDMSFADRITDQNYVDGPVQLVPGQKFRGFIHDVTKPFRPIACFSKLKSLGSTVQLGVHGLMRVFELRKPFLEIGGTWVAFDPRFDVPDEDQKYVLPFIRRISKDQYEMGYRCPQYPFTVDCRPVSIVHFAPAPQPAAAPRT